MLPLQLKLPVVAEEVEKADCADAWFIASLKVTVICVFTGTLLPVGVLPRIVGGVVGGVVGTYEGSEGSIGPFEGSQVSP